MRVAAKLGLEKQAPDGAMSDSRLVQAWSPVWHMVFGEATFAS